MENSREKKTGKTTVVQSQNTNEIRRIPTFSIKGQWRIEDVFECKKNQIIS